MARNEAGGNLSTLKSHDLRLYQGRLRSGGLSEEARKRGKEELGRLELLKPESTEYSHVRTYLDWLTSLPRTDETARPVTLDRVRRTLSKSHYGLPKLKERILEHAAVELRHNSGGRGAIFLFVGPPGVGKLSFARATAEALGRPFVRVGLTGLSGESAIKGVRPTQPGAQPSRIVQGLCRARSLHPVFLLEEIDKLGADGRDPSSALWELFDPDQSRRFEDDYLGFPLDLSGVVFIATASVAEAIAHAVIDQMEVIEFAGYTPEEKRDIATRHLIPKQLRQHAMKPQQLRFPMKTLDLIIDDYTREAGVTELDRQLARVCRKVVTKRATGAGRSRIVKPKDLVQHLGPRHYILDVAERLRRPGVVVGVAWTPTGGEILFVEATRTKGQARFELTGMLGDVMQESAKIALAYVRSRARHFEIKEDIFNDSDIHVHVPSGAVPKDGPSAGVTIAAALVSLLARGRGRRAHSRVAITGELTLRGAILAVGGVEEKLAAARRAGIETLLLPKENQSDVAALPRKARQGIKIHFVRVFDDVVKLALRE